MYLFINNIAIYLFVFYLGSIVYGETKTSICILIKSNALTENEIITIENRLSNYAIQVGSYKVIERRALKYIFQEQEFQLTDYVSNNKVDELGGMLGVTQILIGNISITDEMYNIDFKIDDIRTGEIVSSSSRLIQKDYIILLNSLSEISLDLFGIRTEKNQLPVSIPIRSFRLDQSECQLTKVDYLNSPGSDFLSFHKIDNYILSSRINGSLYKIYSEPELKQVKVFNYPKWTFTSSGTLTNDNIYFAIGGNDGTVYLWETDKWNIPYQLKQNTSRITSVLFTKDDRYLITGDSQGRILFWDYLTHEVIFENIDNNIAIDNIIGNGDGLGIVIQYTDGTFSLFNILDEKMESTEYTMEDITSKILIDKTNNQMIYGNNDGKLSFRNLSYYTEPYLLKESWIIPNIELQYSVEYSGSIIQSLAISDSNDLLALGFNDGFVNIYDLVGHNECGRIKIGDGSVQSLLLFNNNILAGVADSNIHLIEYD